MKPPPVTWVEETSPFPLLLFSSVLLAPGMCSETMGKTCGVCGGMEMAPTQAGMRNRPVEDCSPGVCVCITIFFCSHHGKSVINSSGGFDYDTQLH